MLRAIVSAAALIAVLVPVDVLGASFSTGDRVDFHRAATPLPLDPTLADPRWNEGALQGPLLDLGTKSPAGVATSVSLWYDDRAVYVGVHAEQKTAIVATQATDDVGYGTDDFVAVMLDVTGNGGRTYMFAVTPRGTRYAFAVESTRTVRSAGRSTSCGTSRRPPSTKRWRSTR